MQASGTLGTVICRIEGDVDPIVPWEERVGVIESERAWGAKQADVVECMDGMRFTKRLLWWLVLLGGDRITCGICTRTRATAGAPAFRTISEHSHGENTHEY